MTNVDKAVRGAHIYINVKVIYLRFFIIVNKTMGRKKQPHIGNGNGNPTRFDETALWMNKEECIM